MPPPPTLPLPRDGVKKPSNNLESQLMPPPAVIPCEPPVTMRHVGDLMSSSLRQGKPKEEIGKEDEMIKRTYRAAALFQKVPASIVIGSTQSDLYSSE